VTVPPRASISRVRARPMKPVAPAIATFMAVTSADCAWTAEPGARTDGRTPGFWSRPPGDVFASSRSRRLPDGSDHCRQIW
jgi:hypothetical protein